MILPYFILLIFCVCIVYVRVNKFQHISLVDWSILFIGLIYGFSSTLIIKSEGDIGLFTKSMGQDYILSWAHVTALLILITSILLGWESTKKLLKNKMALRIVSEKRLKNLAWFLLLIAISFQYFYSSAYGGFIEMLKFSLLIRAGAFDQIGVSNSLSFLQPFAMLSYFSSFIFFSLLFSKSKSNILFIGFVLSFLFSIYVMYSLHSRLEYILYLSVFCIFYLYLKRINPLKVITFSIFSPILGLSLLYILAVYLGIKVDNDSSFTDFIAKELSFTYASFYTHADSGYFNPSLYIELLFSPLYLLPSSWNLVFFEQASAINTIAILGAQKGQDGNTSNIPVDLVTLGIIQGRWFGVILIGYLFGFLLKYLEYVIYKVSHGELKVILLSYLIVKFSINVIFYASPTQIIIGNFSFYLFLFLMFLLSLKIKV